MQPLNDISTEELIKLLASTRQNEEGFKTSMKQLLDNVKQSQEYQTYDTLAKAEAALIENLTAEIKERAIADYKKTGNKKPFAGVTVKIFKVFKVLDEVTMFPWVAENFKAAVKTVYDMKQIENLAKSTDIPGTAIEEEVRAEIASKLP